MSSAPEGSVKVTCWFMLRSWPFLQAPQSPPSGQPLSSAPLPTHRQLPAMGSRTLLTRWRKHALVPRPRGVTQLPQVFSPWDEEGSEDSLLQPPNQPSQAQFPTFRETAHLLSPVPALLSPTPYPL